MQRIYYLALVSLTLLFLACSEEKNIKETKSLNQQVTKAVAVIHPLSDSEVSGTVHFTETGDGVKVEAVISGLSETKHGFHIHQYGDCTEPDGSSAGGHFNPESQDHSGPEMQNRHMGDMGNITTNPENPVTSYSYTDQKIDLNMILGRAVIIHAKEDDLTSQPTGAAGSRLACGVIGITQ